MATKSADDYRARATQLRHIAGNMRNRQASIGLDHMADALDAEADQLDCDAIPSPR